jgi:hypothetical protein
VQGDGNTVTCQGAAGLPGAAIDERLMADAAAFADVPPEGDGPWPFAVVNTLDQGLKVRTTNTRDGDQLGGLAPHHVAWAVCKTTSDFDPDHTTRSGPIWLQIKWDQHTPSSDFYKSRPGQRRPHGRSAGT